MKKLIPFQMLIASTVQVVVPKTDERILCLLKYQFYHRPSDKCYELFDESPCGSDQWLTPTSIPGDVECQPIPPDISPDCNSLAILENGNIQCNDLFPDCETLTILDDGDIQCHEVYRTSSCQEGQILLPENFIENTKPCPDQFKCSGDYKSAYSFIKEHFHQGKLRNNVKQFWSSQLCNGTKEKKMACIPTEGSLALDQNKMMVQSFKPPKYSCQVNPCPLGKWPWLSEDGYQRCLEGSAEDINGCWGQIEEVGGSIECQTYESHFSGDNANEKCPKRKIFRGGRCVPRFFG